MLCVFSSRRPPAPVLRVFGSRRPPVLRVFGNGLNHRHVLCVLRLLCCVLQVLLCLLCVLLCVLCVLLCVLCVLLCVTVLFVLCMLLFELCGIIHARHGNRMHGSKQAAALGVGSGLGVQDGVSV